VMVLGLRLAFIGPMMPVVINTIIVTLYH
jgi:hypothetical protein